MTKITPSPALDPNWKEMTLPHYLKELRLAIQAGWEKDPLTPKAEIKTYEEARKVQEKKGERAKGSGRTHPKPEPNLALISRFLVQRSKGTA